MLPNRDSLSLGERIMAYLPRCADTDTDIRKVAIQVSAIVLSFTASFVQRTIFHFVIYVCICCKVSMVLQKTA
jgi:maestro heat-like repeat-containing protein family member 1